MSISALRGYCKSWTEAVGVDDAVGRVSARLREGLELAEQASAGVSALVRHYASEVKNLIADRRLDPGVVEALYNVVMAAEDYTSISDDQRVVFEQAGVPTIYCEMLQGVRAIEDMPLHNGQISRLSKGMSQNAGRERTENWQPRIYITGEGSSIAIPGELALNVSRDMTGAELVTRCCGELIESGEEIALGDTVIITSNSGQTDTALKLARKALSVDANVIGITRNPESELARLCGEENTIILQCGKETAVGATKSVVESCFVVSNLIRGFSGEHLADDLDMVAAEYGTALTQEIPREFVRALSRARSIVIVGSDGVHREAALKVAETIGVPVRIIDRPFGLHGDEETFHAEEAVLFVEPYKEKLGKIEALIGNRGIPLFYITSDDEVAASLPEMRALKAERVGIYQPVVNLGVIQKLLIDLAVYKNSNCVPKHARKVGDAAQV